MSNVINGVVDATAANNTVNTGDVVNAGSNSTNTFNMLVATAADPGLITLNGIQTVNVRALAQTNVNALLYTGTTNFNSSGSSAAVVVNNALLATTFGLSNTVPAMLANLTVNFAGGQVNGTTDVAKLALNGGVGSSIVASGNVTATVMSPVITLGAGIESVALTTSGTNFATLRGTDAITGLTVTGSGTNTLNLAEIGTALAVNASTSTGTNTFDFGAGFSTTDSVVGGTGTDTVRATLSGIVTNISLTGVENFRLNAGSSGTVAFATNPGLTTLESRATAAVGVTGLTTVSNINFVGTASTGAQAFGALTLNSAFAGTADSVTVRLSNQTTATNTYSATINSTGIETLTVNQIDASAATTTTLTFGASSDATKTGFNSLVFNSAGNVNIGTVDATTTPTAGGSLTSINASGVAGAFTATTAAASLANGATIVLGAGGTGDGNNLTVGAESASQTVSITGGAWIDTVTVNAGIFTANLGSGNDVFNGRQATSFSAFGEAGNDRITASLGTDVIVGGSGADTAVFAIGSTTAAVAQASVLTPTGLGTGEFLNVVVNGTTYSVVWGTDLATTLGAFVTAYETAIETALGTGSALAATATTLTLSGNTNGAAFTMSGSITGIGSVAVTTPTPGSAEVVVAATSTQTNLDLLTYVNADGDIIDLGATAVINVAATAGTAGSAAAINATGLATFIGTAAQLPTSLTQAVSFVEAGIATGTATAGQSAVFVFNNQAYLFVSDGTDGVSATADVLVALTGINTLTTGMTLGGGDITGIV